MFLHVSVILSTGEVSRPTLRGEVEDLAGGGGLQALGVYPSMH